MPSLQIFVVPGICSSELEDNGRRLWVDPLRLVKGGFWKLRRAPPDDRDALPDVAIRAPRLLPWLYDKLSARLESAFAATVTPFPYDWRKGIPANGRLLAARLDAVLTEAGACVALVAHSMGGLVAADAVARLPPARREEVAGLVTLGTPWLGAYLAVRALLLEGLKDDALASLAHLNVDALFAVLQSFHGLIHLVPPDNPLLLDPALYEPGPLATDADLRAALAEVTSIVRRPPPRTFALVSDGYPTLAGLHRDSAGLAWAHRPGDGVVPFASATAYDVPFARVTAFHPAMPLYPSVIRETIRALTSLLAA